MKTQFFVLLISAFLMASGAFAQTKVKLETTEGDIVLRLDDDQAPLTVKNFLDYVREGFYDGTIFHRVIKNFMIQGGGMDENLVEKKNRAPIKNEAENGLKNDALTVAMARTAVVDSATSQFFINLRDNDFLNHGSRDYGYAVFGKVVEGGEIVKAIGRVETASRKGFDDVPKNNVTILKAVIVD